MIGLQVPKCVQVLVERHTHSCPLLQPDNSRWVQVLLEHQTHSCLLLQPDKSMGQGRQQGRKADRLAAIMVGAPKANPFLHANQTSFPEVISPVC